MGTWVDIRSRQTLSNKAFSSTIHLNAMEAPDVRYIMYLMQLTLLMHLIHVMVETSIIHLRRPMQ